MILTLQKAMSDSVPDNLTSTLIVAFRPVRRVALLLKQRRTKRKILKLKFEEVLNTQEGDLSSSCNLSVSMFQGNYHVTSNGVSIVFNPETKIPESYLHDYGRKFGLTPDIITAIPIEDKYLIYFLNGRDPVLLDSELRSLGRLDARIRSTYRHKSETGANFGRNRGIYKSKIYYVSEERDDAREHHLRMADLAPVLTLVAGESGLGEQKIETKVVARRIEEFAINPSNGVVFTLNRTGNIEVVGAGMSRQLDPEGRYAAEFYSSIGLHKDLLLVAGCCPQSHSYVLFSMTKRLEVKFSQTFEMPKGTIVITQVSSFLRCDSLYGRK